jgi:hypothetical protein
MLKLILLIGRTRREHLKNASVNDIRNEEKKFGGGEGVARWPAPTFLLFLFSYDLKKFVHLFIC